MLIKKEECFLKVYKIIIAGILISIALFIFNYIWDTFIEDKVNINNKLSMDNSLFFDSDVLAQTTNRDTSQLMARAINGEARGEPYIGQVAVGAVILNRVEHPSFPNTIVGVIYQPGAFTAVSDGQINIPISTNSTAYKAAKDAMNGWDPTGGAIYYYNPAKTTNKWIWSRPVVKVIGKHRFAK